MDVDPSSPFPETGDDVRSNSPAMETDDAPANAGVPPQNVLGPRNPNAEEGPLTPAQIQVPLQSPAWFLSLRDQIHIQLLTASFLVR